MSNVLDRSFFSESSESKLNSSDEKEMILKRNLDVVDQKYIGMNSFVFRFLKCIGFNEKIKKWGV